jgi:hypothetical protein
MRPTHLREPEEIVIQERSLSAVPTGPRIEEEYT